MDRQTFQLACEVLWGPLYRQEAGRQLAVSPRTAQRWDSGETEQIPGWVAEQLRTALQDRRQVIDKLLELF